MSHYITVVCDDCFIDLNNVLDEDLGKNELNKLARSQGWKVKNGQEFEGRKHYCPTCWAKREKETP